MNAADAKPVIFLALANDRDERVGYLRNLPKEARRVSEAFDRACRFANRNLTQAEWKQHLGQYYGDASYHKTCPDLPAGG